MLILMIKERGCWLPLRSVWACVVCVRGMGASMWQGNGLEDHIRWNEARSDFPVVRFVKAWTFFLMMCSFFFCHFFLLRRRVQDIILSLWVSRIEVWVSSSVTFYRCFQKTLPPQTSSVQTLTSGARNRRRSDRSIDGRNQAARGCTRREHQKDQSDAKSLAVSSKRVFFAC